MLNQIENHLLTFDYNCSPAPGIRFPTRSVLLRIPKNRMLIISPGPFDEKAIAQINALADEIILVSPNLFHHFYLEQSFEVWPSAQIYAEKKLASKQPWAKPYLQDIGTLPAILNKELKTYRVRGNQFLSETIFYDEMAKTLIVTDLVFNLKEPLPWTTRLAMQIMGAYNQVAQSRLIRFTTKNKLSYKTSIDKLLELDITKVIPSHGEIIDDVSTFKQALVQTLK